MTSWRHLALLAAVLLASACAADKQQGTTSNGDDQPLGATHGTQQPGDPAQPSIDPAKVPPQATLDRVEQGAVAAVVGLRPHPYPRVLGWLQSGDRARVIDALRYSVDTYTDPDQQSAARYVLGRLLTDDLDPAGLPWLESLPAPFGDHDDRRLVWLARAQALNAQREAAIATIDTLRTQHASVDEVDALRVTRAELLHQLDRTGEAIEAAEAVGSDSDVDEHLRARALRLAADWLRPTDLDAARRHELTLLTRYPASEHAALEGMSMTLDDLDDATRFRRAQRLERDWAYTEARQELRRLVDHPKFGDEAAYDIGMISLRKLRDDPVEARAMFQKAWDAGYRKEDSLYYIMRSHLREEDYDTGLKIADRYDKQYKRGKYRQNMAYYRGWLPYDHRDCKAALPGLEAYWKDRLGDRRSVVMGFWAWCFVRLEDWQGAVDAFGKVADSYGNSVVRGKAWYWQARALHELGRDDEALSKLADLDARYPLTYYAVLGWQLRAVIEGRDPTASKQPWPEGGGDADARFPIERGLDAEPWQWPSLSGSTERRFDTVRRLLQLGEVDLARGEYRSIRDTVEKSVSSDKRKRFIHFMSHQIEDFHHPYVLVGGDLTQPGTPDATDIDWVLGYPRAYAPLVERLADEFDGVPAEFVFSIMRQESRYRPHQISGADAVGALQMIPKTARKVADDLGVEFDLRTFVRPEEGFRYSFHYMKNHLETWNHQLVPTAASYNGGPEPIGRWIRQNPDADMATLIEEFAYNESRIYCRKVAEHMLRYLYLYEDDPEVRGRWLDSLFPVDFDSDIPDDVGY